MYVQTKKGIGIVVESDEECVSVQYEDGSYQFWLWSEVEPLSE